MAYATPRSANDELDEGMTDGKYKKVVTDRGGVVDPLTYQSRACLTDAYFGIHEDPVKLTPDGLEVRTKNCVHTPLASPEYF